MLEFHHEGRRIGRVLAMHLNGDSSPKGHRYHLSEDVLTARYLDIYTEGPAKNLASGSGCALVEDEKRLILIVQGVFDLRDHVLVKATPRE